MIVIVDPSNAGEYREEMEAAYRLRHRVFVDEKRWMALQKPDGREVDQFDDEHAVHMLCILGGEVVGYQRMLPTMRPYLLSDVYPQLCEEAIPRSPHVWEWTRYAVEKKHRARGRMLGLVANQMLSAIVEWGLERDINSIVIEMNPLWMLRLVQLNFRVRPLGLIQLIDDEEVLAVQAAFDERTLKRLRETRGDEERVLARRQLADAAAS